MCFFMIISEKYSQPLIISTALDIFLTLKLAVIHFSKHTFFQCILEHQSP